MLAKKNDGSGTILEVEEEVREMARKDIHAGKVRFVDWVREQGGVVDSGTDLDAKLSILMEKGLIKF